MHFLPLSIRLFLNLLDLIRLSKVKQLQLSVLNMTISKIPFSLRQLLIGISLIPTYKTLEATYF